MYLTGGIGPSHSNEGFTRDYDLPDESAYAETCAAIGLVLWSHRMLQFGGDGKYADILERALYNGLLSGVSLDGTHFFYDNPLASIGHHHRTPWFFCPCCPPNVARTHRQRGQLFLFDRRGDVWVHLYGQNVARLEIGDSSVEITERTNYPWDGDVRFEMTLDTPKTFALHLRLPGWCDRYTLKINGASVDTRHGASLHNGYISIDREWQSGDVVEFDMTMLVQTVYAHPSVRQIQGRVALQRGPLVYCLEGVDNNLAQLERISVDVASVNEFVVEHQPDLLGGVSLIRGQGRILTEDGWDGALYRNTASSSQPVEITAIPYYAWDNRAASEMRVWVRTH